MITNCTSLIYDKQESIATITLNRPEVLNAMNRQLWGELTFILDEVEVDKEVMVVVILGTGQTFSSGADLKERVQYEDNLYTCGLWAVAYSEDLKEWIRYLLLE